jgi:HSP20 family protein
MALTRWSPMAEFAGLRSAMDHLVEDMTGRANGWTGRAFTAPAYDLYESEDGLTFRFAIPGIRPEDVEVTVNQGVLYVKGQYPRADEGSNWHWHVRGLPQGGEFRFSFRLPTAVDADRAEAHFEYGVLTLSLPRSEASKPKRIAISAPATATTENG